MKPIDYPNWLPWSHQDDLALSEGCRFDENFAIPPGNFFKKYLKHSKGQWAGKPFSLLPWQYQQIIAPLFGWIRPDNTRRFRRASIWVPKKQGKSTLCAGLVIYGLLGVGESGAEVYGAAADRKQASIIYDEVTHMIEQNPHLAGRLELIRSKRRVVYEETYSAYEVLSAEAKKTGHGINASMVIIDELHVVSRKLYDTLRYAGASRQQPLFVEISTAGSDRESLGYERYLYAKKVATGTIDDIETLAFIAEADNNDAWEDPAQWHKANPSLGVTVSLDGFKADLTQAKNGTPADMANFRQLRLNLWQDTYQAWVPMDRWDACGETFDDEDIEGLPCYGALDLASTTDTASLAMVWPKDTREVFVRLWVWVPEDACRERERLNRTRFQNWVQLGFMTETEGSCIDYDVIRNTLRELSVKYNIQEVAIDRWNATQLATQLQGDGLKIVAFGMGFASMSAPTKELERLIKEKLLRHGGNPVARWFASNVSIEMDAAGNVKPSKRKSSEKIDGIVALVMALGRMLVREEVGSIYDTPGSLTL